MKVRNLFLLLLAMLIFNSCEKEKDNILEELNDEQDSTLVINEIFSSEPKRLREFVGYESGLEDWKIIFEYDSVNRLVLKQYYDYAFNRWIENSRSVYTYEGENVFTQKFIKRDTAWVVSEEIENIVHNGRSMEHTFYRYDFISEERTLESKMIYTYFADSLVEKVYMKNYYGDMDSAAIWQYYYDDGLLVEETYWPLRSVYIPFMHTENKKEYIYSGNEVTVLYYWGYTVGWNLTSKQIWLYNDGRVYSRSNYYWDEGTKAWEIGVVDFYKYTDTPDGFILEIDDGDRMSKYHYEWKESNLDLFNSEFY